MRKEQSLPDLTFPSVTFGEKQTRWDLQMLLHPGASGGNAKAFAKAKISGELCPPFMDRLEVVQRIYDVLNGRLAGGGRKESAQTIICWVRAFVAWCDKVDAPLTVETVQATYLQWTEALLHRSNALREISKLSAYSFAAGVGQVLDEVLMRHQPMLRLSRISFPSRDKPAIRISGERQNLTDTFQFGHFLQDICDGLPVEAVLRGHLPIKIRLRKGMVLEEWSGTRRQQTPNNWKSDANLNESLRRSYQRSESARSRREAEGTLLTRYPLVNLRCEAELLMFVGQTGMNLTQAIGLRLRHFSYTSHLDGYQVKERKYRKGGDVLFEIFSDYKSHFERYLTWRRIISPESDILFPFVRPLGAPQFANRGFFRLREICKIIEIPFVTPRVLRNTRINWMLRRSGDLDQTAEIHQHSKKTLLRHYETPSEHRATGEIIRFWSSHDPIYLKSLPISPGECDGRPKPSKGIPNNILQPDCIRPSGCLWCDHHRDIDSSDHVWALASFRHLKIIEASKWHPPEKSTQVHPAQQTITKISDKLSWFRESGAHRLEWVVEAMNRMEEGNYHPSWTMQIRSLEGMP